MALGCRCFEFHTSYDRPLFYPIVCNYPSSYCRANVRDREVNKGNKKNIIVTNCNITAVSANQNYHTILSRCTTFAVGTESASAYVRIRLADVKICFVHLLDKCQTYVTLRRSAESTKPLCFKQKIQVAMRMYQVWSARLPDSPGCTQVSKKRVKYQNDLRTNRSSKSGCDLCKA